MLYQGEDIAITVTFNEDVLSQASSFTLLVYPSFNVNMEPVSESVNKDNIKDGRYTFIIPSSTTKEMPTGLYTIEVLMKTSSNTRSIFQKKEAFPLYYAKAKEVK